MAAEKNLSDLKAPRGPSTSDRKDTLCHVCKDNAYAYNKGTECIEEYIDRNGSFEIIKAIAIEVMLTAKSKWDKGIVEASELASDVTGYSSETIRRWAYNYFNSIATLTAV